MSDHKGPWSPFEPPPPPRRRMSPVRVIVWLAVLAVFGGAIYLLARQFPGQDRQDWTRVAWLGLLLVAASSRILTGARPDWNRTARYASVWVSVVAVIALGFTYRTELLSIAQRLRGELIPGLAQTATDASGAPSLVVTQTEAGYQIMGAVNGQAVRFIVDTGATDTVLSPADARRAGLDVANLDFSHTAETANGMGRGARAVASTLSVGGIEVRDMPVVVNQAPMTSSLLGMTFLSRLDSFEVRGGRLYLRPKR